MSFQYDEIRLTNGWDPLAGLGYPSKFQRLSRVGFVTAPTSLIGGQPNFARCLAVSWGGALYIHFRGPLPLTEFCQVQSSLYVQVLRSHILAALLHSTPLQQQASAKLCGVVHGMESRNFHRGRHLYLAGRPSGWPSDHILVYLYFYVICTYVTADESSLMLQ